jgi:basic amino acid/polyamine antiporter, APA family
VPDVRTIVIPLLHTLAAAFRSRAAVTGVFMALCSSFTNINELVELTNIGTMFALALVAIGLLVLRQVNPGVRGRPFRPRWFPGCLWRPLAAVFT